jgi:hypothetical protein
MFFVMAEIGSVRLKRCAFAKILRLNFTKIDTPARYCIRRRIKLRHSQEKAI